MSRRKGAANVVFLQARHALALALAFAAGSLGACSLLTDLGGYATKERDTPDGSKADAVADASGVPDASEPCPPNAFCRDFDDVTDPADGWDRREVAMGTFALSTDTFKTPDASFASAISPGNDFYAAALVHEGVAAGFATFRFSLFIDQISTNPNPVCPFALTKDPGCTLRMYVKPGSIALQQNQNGSSMEENTPFDVPQSRWFDVRIEIDMPNKVGAIYVDGNKVVSDALLCDWLTGGGRRAFLGIYYTKGQAGQRFLYDHVIFETR